MMFRQMTVVLSAVLSLASTSASADIAKKAVVYLQSEAGNYVGGGLGAPEVTWVHGIDGVFFGGSYGAAIDISYHGDDYFDFDFAAPDYDPVTNTVAPRPLTVGRYDNAQRFPFNSPTKPGLSVYGAGRGDNISSGWFEVFQVAYGADGVVDQLAVDFSQYDENKTQSGPRLFGSLRFNSDVALHFEPTAAIPAVPEPSSALAMLAGLGILAAAQRRKRS